MKQSLTRRILSLITALVLVGLPSLPAGAAAAAAQAAGPYISDGFGGGLDPAVWSFVDPLGDTRLLSAPQPGGDVWLSLVLPAGVAHEAWRDGNLAPRILQPVADTDLDLEAGFTARLVERYQQVGLVFEGDAEDSLLLGSTHAPGKLAGDIGRQVEGGVMQQFLADADHAAHLMCRERDLTKGIIGFWDDSLFLYPGSAALAGHQRNLAVT